MMTITPAEWMAVNRLKEKYDSTAFADYTDEEKPAIKGFYNAFEVAEQGDRDSFLDLVNATTLEYCAQELDFEIEDLYDGFNGGEFRPTVDESWMSGPSITQDDWWEYFNEDRPGEWGDVRYFASALVGCLLAREKFLMVASRKRYLMSLSAFCGV